MRVKQRDSSNDKRGNNLMGRGSHSTDANMKIGGHGNSGHDSAARRPLG